MFATGFSAGAGFCYLLLTMRPERFAAFAPVAMFPFPCLKWAAVPRPVLIVRGKQEGLSYAEWARNQVLRLNGCGPEAVAWDRGAVSYSTCASNQPVVWYVHNGGHIWPRDATANVVRFFKAHALPVPPPALHLPADPDPSGAVAGSGKAGFSGDGGHALAAQLLFPESVSLDSAGNLFIADTSSNRVRKVGRDGIITTVAGTYDSGSRKVDRATETLLFLPEGIAVDRAGNLFLADTSNRLVRKVTPEGLIRTVAGKETQDFLRISFSGDGGPGPEAELSFPAGLAVDRENNLFIADGENHRVRKVTPDGIITTVAGTGTAGFSGDGGAAEEALLNVPWGVATDGEGNLFIADSANHRVRKVSPDGTIRTVAGTGTAGFSGDEGTATAAQLNNPSGVAVDSQGNLFIVDRQNYRVRKVTPEGMTTVFGGPGSDGSNAARHDPAGVAVDREGSLLIADPFYHRVWKVSGVAAAGLIAGEPFPQP